jgi:hypothetical protein
LTLAPLREDRHRAQFQQKHIGIIIIQSFSTEFMLTVISSKLSRAGMHLVSCFADLMLCSKWEDSPSFSLGTMMTFKDLARQ